MTQELFWTLPRTECVSITGTGKAYWCSGNGYGIEFLGEMTENDPRLNQEHKALIKRLKLNPELK